MKLLSSLWAGLVALIMVSGLASAHPNIATMVAQVTPTTMPTTLPTNAPTSAPTTYPTVAPTTYPTTVPTSYPTSYPTTYPTTVPAYIQSVPTTAPTTVPTTYPTTAPTSYPTSYPTTAPTTVPTTYPTSAPTSAATSVPTTAPTTVPTTVPTSYPTVIPGTPPPTVTASPSPTSTPYIKISGTVMSISSSGGLNGTLNLTSGGTATVYSSYFTYYVVGDVVSATGYYNTTGAFLAASMKLVSTPAPSPTPTPVPSPTATPFVAPSTIPMTHIWNFNYYGSLTQAQNCATIAPYVSVVYPKGSEVKTWHTCGVKAFSYASPAMPQNGEYEMTSAYGGSSLTATPAPSPGPYYSVLAKDCSGNLITSYNGTGLEFDPHSSNAAAYLSDSINHAITTSATWNSGDTPEYLFHDNSDEIYGLSAQPCTWKGQNDWATITLSDYNAANPQSKPVILNTLALITAYSVPPADDTIANVTIPLQSANVAGAMYEGWVWGNQNQSGYNTLTGTGSSWQSQEDTQIAVLKMNKIFNALANGPFTTYENTNGADSANGIAARMYVYASLLLTYDPTLTLWGEEVTNTTSGWMQFPEEGLVAMYPVVPATSISSVLSLQHGTNGPYVREYQGCYYRGAYLGACAVVVNPSTSIVAVSLPAYQHSMVLAGSDIIDGGTATFSGPAVTSLGPKSAAILLL